MKTHVSKATGLDVCNIDHTYLLRTDSADEGNNWLNFFMPESKD
jgi:hypothetical protein